jgi:hypothetical protein
LGTPEAVVDRLAVALGVRDGGGPRAGARVTIDPEALRFRDGRLFERFLPGEDGAFEAASRGYARLGPLLDAFDGDAWCAVASLLDPSPRAASLGTTGTAAIIVPIGMQGGVELLWTVNLEAGRRTNANVRIAGGQGKGKTQFLEHLLASLAGRSDTGVLLLDYKGDISGDADFVQAASARVIRAHNEAVPINPFDVPPGARPGLVALEVATLLRSINTGMGAAQQEIVRVAVEEAYTSSPGSAPTATAIAAAVRRSYESAGKPPDTVTAWLAQLAELGLFRDRTEGGSEHFLKGRWIIDLSGLGALRALVAFVILHWASRQIQALGDTTLHPGALRRLRCVLAIDEAHHYLRARCEPLLVLLRIGRSKGVPVILSSQSLSDFREHTETDELFAWTFLLGHGAKPETRILQAALSLSAAEAQQAADLAVQLPQFEALVPSEPDGPRPPRARLHPFFERRWRVGA